MGSNATTDAVHLPAGAAESDLGACESPANAANLGTSKDPQNRAPKSDLARVQLVRRAAPRPAPEPNPKAIATERLRSIVQKTRAVTERDRRKDSSTSAQSTTPHDAVQVEASKSKKLDKKKEKRRSHEEAKDKKSSGGRFSLD